MHLSCPCCKQQDADLTGGRISPARDACNEGRRLPVDRLAHHRGCHVIPGGMAFFTVTQIAKDRPTSLVDAGRAVLFPDFFGISASLVRLYRLDWQFVHEGGGRLVGDLASWPEDR